MDALQIVKQTPTNLATQAKQLPTGQGPWEPFTLYTEWTNLLELSSNLQQLQYFYVRYCPCECVFLIHLNDPTWRRNTRKTVVCIGTLLLAGALKSRNNTPNKCSTLAARTDISTILTMNSQPLLSSFAFA